MKYIIAILIILNIQVTFAKVPGKTVKGALKSRQGFFVDLHKCGEARPEFPKDEPNVETANFILIEVPTECLEKRDTNLSMGLQVIHETEKETEARFKNTGIPGVRDVLYSTQDKLETIKRFIVVEEFADDQQACWTTYNICTEMTVKISFCSPDKKPITKEMRLAILKGNLSIPDAEKSILDSVKCTIPSK